MTGHLLGEFSSVSTLHVDGKPCAAPFVGGDLFRKSRLTQAPLRRCQSIAGIKWATIEFVAAVVCGAKLRFHAIIGNREESNKNQVAQNIQV